MSDASLFFLRDEIKDFLLLRITYLIFLIPHIEALKKYCIPVFTKFKKMNYF